MMQRSVLFNTFTVEREYPVDAALVFAAFSDPLSKTAWLNSPDSTPEEITSDYEEFDFRVGGRERFEFTEEDGRKMRYDALYYDILPNERIVYSYEMYAGENRISVSVATIQLTGSAGGTSLSWTEQGAFLDGHDKPELREGGTSWMLDNLAAHFNESS